MAPARPGLNREAVVRAALTAVRDTGLAGLTMRAVAAELGCSPMALYRHVADKQELRAAMLDELLGRLDLPPARLTPTTRLTRLARGLRDLALADPVLVELALSMPAAGTHGVLVVDAIYRAMLDLGAPPAEIPRLERLYSTLALGLLASELQGRFARDVPSPRERLATVGADRAPAYARLLRAQETRRTPRAEYEAAITWAIAALPRDRPRWSGQRGV